MFKIGDKVIRTDDGYHACRPDVIYTIKDIWGLEEKSLVLKELSFGTYMAKNFRRVEPLPDDLFEI